MNFQVEHCSNNYCLYYKGEQCILDVISINEIGACDSFTLIDIPEDVMESYRQWHLLKIKTRFDNWN